MLTAQASFEEAAVIILAPVSEYLQENIVH